MSLLRTSCILVALFALFTTTANAEPLLPRTVSSTNWAGYDAVRRVPDRRFLSVSARWIEPSIDCALSLDAQQDPITSYSAFWVGLDGDGSETVEQIGTEANCIGFEQAHNAWWEMYPDYPVELELEINPGDEISASVTFIGGSRFALALKDLTTGGKIRVVRKLKGAARHSAEAIAEAPYSSLFGVLPLSPFGQVQFSSVRFNEMDPSRFPSLQRIHMTDPEDRSIVRAETSDFLAGRFSIAWLRT